MALYRCGSSGGTIQIRIKGYSYACGYKKQDGAVLGNMKAKSFDIVYQINSDGTITKISGATEGSNVGIDQNTNVYGVYGSGYQITKVSII